MVNEDIIKGSAKHTEGKIEEAYGVLIDSAEHTVNGKAKQAEGAVQEGTGHIKQAIADAVKANGATTDVKP